MKLKIKLRNILSVKIHKIVLLLLALCIYNTAYGQNQRISVYGNNQSLQKVFEQIEEQTQLSITYNQTRLDVNRKIKGNFVDKELSFVMDALLKNTGFTCRYEAEHIVITPVEQKKEKAAAGQATQMKKITGKVTGVTGEPLIGANVLAVGGKQATITNLEGEFSLEVSDNSKLQVTYIGYLPQEVSTNGKTHFVIQLKEDSQLMDEVVVVGFGTQKKVNLTGAVTAVNIQETLGDRPITNVTAALQGVVPGLKIEGTTGTPGDNLSYNIRGTTSINGGGPLVLVNNVPMDINMIDPQDIESVSVLKDAASAAIYGARAAFGVILITTKQGKKDMAPKFNYNNNFSFSKALELPQKAGPLESILAYKDCVLDRMDQDWIPVEKSWRLNEKHYGDLQGLNKSETAAKYGDGQVLIWRRSYDIAPNALSEDDPRNPRFENRYQEVPDAELPRTESLKDTIERIMPYWKCIIFPNLKTADEILVVAHGNSLRGIIKHLKHISDEEIVKLNLPTAVPYVFEFSDELNLEKDYFLGDPEEIRKLMEAVANQGKKK